MPATLSTFDAGEIAWSEPARGATGWLRPCNVFVRSTREDNALSNVIEPTAHEIPETHKQSDGARRSVLRLDVGLQQRKDR